MSVLRTGPSSVPESRSRALGAYRRKLDPPAPDPAEASSWEQEPATRRAKPRRRWPEKFGDAFREECRAMLVLMEAVHRYRGKNEDFKPLW